LLVGKGGIRLGFGGGKQDRRVRDIQSFGGGKNLRGSPLGLSDWGQNSCSRSRSRVGSREFNKKEEKKSAFGKAPHAGRSTGSSGNRPILHGVGRDNKKRPVVKAETGRVWYK